MDKLQDHSKLTGKVCHQCGGKRQPSTCRYKEYECRYCRKKGHLAAIHVRRRKRKADSEQTHPEKQTKPSKWVGLDSGSEVDEYEESLYHVSDGKSKTNPITVRVAQVK